jgi:hypothetical protein
MYRDFFIKWVYIISLTYYQTIYFFLMKYLLFCLTCLRHCLQGCYYWHWYKTKSLMTMATFINIKVRVVNDSKDFHKKIKSKSSMIVMIYSLLIKESYIDNQQWIDLNGKRLGLLEHVVRGSISGSCVPRKFGWEGRTHLVCLTDFPTEISLR